MPWTVKDVPRFKKGLTTAQKKKWVKVANGALKSCQARGGKNCEASAIKIANSKFSQGSRKMSEKLPKGAMRFVDSGCHAYAAFAEGDDDKKKPSLKMVAYSGGVIKNHWYWDDLAIDLGGIKFTQKRYPVLEDHMTDRKIAHIGKPIVENGKLMAPDNAVFLKTEAAEEFINNTNTSPPFPYQSSIYAKPTVVERVAEGASVDVNGFKLKGPASVWRECEFKEMSVCVFGWDSKTTASAFSREVVEEVDDYSETMTEAPDKPQMIKRRKEVKIVDLEQLKKEYPELYQQIVDSTKSAVASEFAEKEESFKSEISALTQTNEGLTSKVDLLTKKEDQRSERELAAKADTIWEAKLAASDIPDRVDLRQKIKAHVSHHKFVENGVLDVEKFQEAIDTEIASWVEMGIEPSVIGGGNDTLSNKAADGENDEEQLAEDQANVNRLLKAAGQEVKTD